MIGHGVSPLLARKIVLDMSRGFTSKHAQTTGDLCSAMEFNAETFPRVG